MRFNIIRCNANKHNAIQFNSVHLQLHIGRYSPVVFNHLYTYGSFWAFIIPLHVTPVGRRNFYFEIPLALRWELQWFWEFFFFFSSVLYTQTLKFRVPEAFIIAATDFQNKSRGLPSQWPLTGFLFFFWLFQEKVVLERRAAELEEELKVRATRILSSPLRHHSPFSHFIY